MATTSLGTLLRASAAEARRAKYKVILPVLAALAAASIYLHFATFVYTAELKVTPSQGDGNSLGSGVSSLAAIAGVGLPRGQTSNFSLYLEILNSRTVAERLSRDQGLMQTVFMERWNAPLHPTTGEGRAIEQTKYVIKELLGIPNYPKARPNAADLQKFIADNLSISENPKRGVSTISFDFRDRLFAMKFLQRLHRTADDIVRERSTRRADGSIAYLERKLGYVGLAEHRAALAVALSEQERTRMMASSGLPFSAETIGEISVSNRPTRPQPLVVLGFALVFGVAAALSWIFFTRPMSAG